jgi:hypothetical protein
MVERDQALRVAKLLVEKQKPDEAVALLSAWAANGPNDAQGQALLAEALRINPGSPLAKLAFERMEGLSGEHAPLDDAILHYDAKALSDIERQHKRPTFHRAQLGFNNNVHFKSAAYHVQTEDSGIDRPHVITHLFADGGRVIKSFKRTYEKELGREDVAGYVRSLMKAQHMEMCIALRDGEFDEVIAGRAAGGMSVFDEPPRVQIRRGAGEAVAPSQQAVSRGAPKPKPEAPVRVRLVIVRCLWDGPDRFEPRGDDVVLGSQGDVALTGETFAAPKEAVLRYRQGKVSLIGLGGGNGVFMRTRSPVELVFGDEFLIGDQMLRLEANPVPDDGPDLGPTYFYASPRWPSSFRVSQVWQGGALGATCVARGTIVQVGRSSGDLHFDRDPLISDPHCILEEQAGAIVLTDLGSRAGTFVRVTGEREVQGGDEFAIGRTRMRVELV